MEKKIKWKVVRVDRLREIDVEIKSLEKRIRSLKREAKEVTK